MPAVRTTRCHVLALAAVACLLLASGAAAAVGDAFTAGSTPSAVKPATSASYTITLTSDPASPSRADRAKIGIPPGFTVDPATIKATSEATANGCVAAIWEPDGQLIANATINLKRPANTTTGVCPGASLRVSFTATSATAESTYTWATQLLIGTEAFTLNGSQPTILVDGTPPTVSIADPKPSNLSNTRSASFTFTANAPTQCKLDAGPFAPCTSTASYTNLSDGPHTFTVRAADAAGNSTEDSHTWTIETRAPSAAVSSAPPALTNSRLATFVFAADEPSRFECRLDGGTFLPCSSPASYQGLGEGGHTFAVRPIDGVGNLGVAVSRSWRIDATEPETRVISGPRSRTRLLSASLSFSASEQASFQCRLDAGSFTACASPKSYFRLRRSIHTFQVRAIDAAGNVDPTPAIFRWTIAAAVRAAKAASALLTPPTGARVTSPPALAWRRVARAPYYNVQLFRGSRKILSVWPTRTRYRLRATWTFAGRQQRLVPGTYRWYVWPRIGGPRGRYGKLLGQSMFIVRTPARR